MPLISVITPSHRPVREQLLEAYESVRSQRLPRGWEVEWVIQEDGDTGAALDILPEDPVVRFATGRRGGVALTRNMALARSRGDLVKNLDHDDVLTPGVLARDIEVLVSDPLVQWTTSPVLDLLPDGSTVAFDSDPAPGRLEPGYVFEHWRTHGYRLPVHPTSICIRRPLAVALGGWMGVPGSDDTGLLVPASVVSHGYFHGEAGLLYRKWPGQETAAAGHYAPMEWSLRMRLIEERAETVRKLWPDVVGV
ncbi:glycosyltransferase [Nonomuraea sp. SMC257]|uniref:Glycosyltransferase n=1 Tax=Nonomuraea montanisoli TaxID=2741721 RepID=A0A7Y6I4K1_9ACTN|nr:glycosyltransferase [Nonomuraea montanisoli]NUW31605.1 glycosyltransferase [Nonomuraea montanisoli]